MRIKVASLVVVVAMIFSLGGTSVFADPVSDPKTPASETKTSTTSALAAKDETKPDDKLKVEVLKLVADAKAGKVASHTGPQFPRSKRNNMSTAGKIGIAAGIAGVILIVIALHQLTTNQ